MRFQYRWDTKTRSLISAHHILKSFLHCLLCLFILGISISHLLFFSPPGSALAKPQSAPTVDVSMDFPSEILIEPLKVKHK